MIIKMGPDFDKYRSLVAELDLTDEQKDELIQTLWSIMGSFVDRAFGNDPVQQVTAQEAFVKATKSCGEEPLNKLQCERSKSQRSKKDLKP